MKKILKYILITILLLLGFVFAAPFLFKGKIISIIKSEINKNLNANIYFSDNVGLSLIRSFPDFSLSIDSLQIVGKDTFEGDTLCNIVNTSLTLDIMSVVKGGEINIKKIKLEKPYIQLLVNKNGLANWDIAKKDTTTKVEDDTTSAFKLSLKKLEITDGYLLYDDKLLGFNTELKNFNHQLEGDFTQDNFILNTQTTTPQLTMGYGGISYLYKINSDIKADLNMDMKKMRFDFNKNQIKLNNLILGVDGFFQMLPNSYLMDIKYESKQTDFKDILSLVPGIFIKDFKDIQTKGKMKFGGFVKGTMDDYKIPSFQLLLDIKDGYFRYPNMPLAAQDVNIDLDVSSSNGDIAGTIINLKKLQSTLGKDKIDARMIMKNPTQNQYIDANVKCNIDLANLKNIVPHEELKSLTGLLDADVNANGFIKDVESGNYQNFNASGNLDINKIQYVNKEINQKIIIEHLGLQFSPKIVTLDKCKGQIGESDFDATGNLENFYGYIFNNSDIKGNLNFSSTFFNCNQFLSDEQVNNNPQPKDSVSMDIVEIPENINFVMKADIKKLIYDNLTFINSSGEVIIEDSKVKLSNIKTNVLDANVTLAGTYDTKNPKSPWTDFNFDVNKLNIPQSIQYISMIEKIAPALKYVDGMFATKFNMKSNLNNNMQPVYNTMDMTGEFKLTDASVKNLEILKILSSQLKIPQLANLNIKEAIYKFKISEGKFAFIDSVNLPLWQNAKMKISGNSTLDQKLNYGGVLSIPRKDFGTQNIALENMLGNINAKGVKINLDEIINIDFLIGGTALKPEIKLDLKATKNRFLGSIKDQLKNQLNDKKAETEKRVKDSLNNIKQQALQKAEEQKQKALIEAEKQKQIAQEKIRAEEERLKAEARKKEEEAKQKLKEEASKKLKGIIIK